MGTQDIRLLERFSTLVGLSREQHRVQPGLLRGLPGDVIHMPAQAVHAP